MKHLKLSQTDSDYQSFKETGWEYVNPIICRTSNNSKIRYSKRIFPATIELIPEIQYEDETLVSYEFKLKDSDLSLINELYYIYTPLFKLNDDEKAIAENNLGHLAKHITRDTSVFPFSINGIPVLSVTKYFEYTNHNYDIPTYIRDYYTINDIDDRLCLQLCNQIGQNIEHLSSFECRFFQNNLFVSLEFQKD